MQSLTAYFADYASYHQTKGNKTFHRIGIPLIVLTIVAMLERVMIGKAAGVRLDLAMLAIVLVEVWYLILDWRLGLLMLFALAIFWFIGIVIPLWLSVALFILGWIFQFVGHSVYEHRQPAFFRNVTHLLVGPLWILNDVVKIYSR
jgi:uncharacterized membrane protein YGL010W